MSAATYVHAEMKDSLGMIFLGVVALLLAMMLMRTQRHNRELISRLQRGM